MAGGVLKPRAFERAALITALITTSAASFSFISVGDWGGADLPQPLHRENVRQVSTAMSAFANASFIIGTGDNFYQCGIQNISDPQVAADWVRPFTEAVSLPVNWYNVLGNHDYGYNVTAQLELTQHLNQWHMPNEYYTKRLPAGNSHITFIFIDTNPCYQAYRSSDPTGWDPCGSIHHVTCTLNSSQHNDFEGPCHFHENIMSQSCDDQFEWFKDQLDIAPVDDWVIVVGHHPAGEIDVHDFVTPMQARGVSLYLNGHMHTLAHYSVNGKIGYVTTGAAAMVKADDGDWRPPTGDNHGNMVELVWINTTTGFTSHELSDDETTLVTRYHDGTGGAIYSFSVDKSGNSLAAASSEQPRTLASASASAGVLIAALCVCAVVVISMLFLAHANGVLGAHS